MMNYKPKVTKQQNNIICNTYQFYFLYNKVRA